MVAVEELLTTHQCAIQLCLQNHTAMLVLHCFFCVHYRRFVSSCLLVQIELMVLDISDHAVRRQVLDGVTISELLP